MKRHHWIHDPLRLVYRCEAGEVFNVPEAENLCHGCGAEVADRDLLPWRDWPMGACLAADITEWAIRTP